jgi:hypothetical protein
MAAAADRAMAVRSNAIRHSRMTCRSVRSTSGGLLGNNRIHIIIIVIMICIIITIIIVMTIKKN